MKDRIRNLLLNEGLTSGAFADEIGVQRSSLSHILNGRNNPSLDFVIKAKARFPRLSLSWLILGVGEMYSTDNESEGESSSLPPTTPTIFNSLLETSQEENVVEIANDTLDQELTSDIPPKQVDKIVIFYSDKTFCTYNPEKFD